MAIMAPTRATFRLLPWFLLSILSTLPPAVGFTFPRSTHGSPVGEKDTALQVSVSTKRDALTPSLTLPDMSLLEPAQASSSVYLEEMTRILLDSTTHPIGSLSYDVLDCSFPVLYAWGRTRCVEGAETAERVLMRLEEERDMGNHKVKLTNKYYSVAIDAWAKAGQSDAAQQAERLLRHFEQRHQLSRIGRPNRVAYNIVLNAYAQEGKVDDTLRVLKRVSKDEVTVKEYTAMLSAHARAGQAREAEALLHRMVSEEGMPRPNLICYNCVLDANAKNGEADRAESILNSLLESAHTNSAMAPDGRSFACVAQAVIKSGARDMVDRVEQILDQAQSYGVSLDAHLQNVLLDAWAQRGYAEKAETRLERMEKDGIANDVSYSTVLKAWRNSGASDAIRRAEKLLGRMEKLGIADVYAYSNMIQCYTKQNHKGSAAKAERLYEKMIDQARSGESSVKPNVFTVNCVLDALAKSGEPDSAARAEKLLLTVQNNQDPVLADIRLNRISYTSVIDAYARSGEIDAATRAEVVFRRMKEAFAQGNHAAKPNSRAFSAYINAWAQVGTPLAAERAESILAEMEQAYRRGDNDVAPTCVSYSTVMSGWARSGSRDAVHRAEGIFRRMVEMYDGENEYARPSFVCYVALIDAVVKSGGVGAAQKAEDIMLSMYEKYKTGNRDVKPNARLITTVIDCWGKCGVRNGGEKAEALLDWMIETYESEGDTDFMPNEVTFSAVVNAWAKSRHFGKASRARSVLTRMIDLHESGRLESHPTVVVFTGVINACAYTVGDPGVKSDAIQIASGTFNELCRSDYGNPNHVTYAVYMAACQNLLPREQKMRMICELFHRCCQEGQVSDTVVRRVQGVLTPDQLDGFGLKGNVSPAALPKEWKRNVQDRRSTRSRVGSSAK